MNFAIPEEYLQPHQNSDTLHEAMLDEKFPYKVGEYEERLAIASLSLVCRLVEQHDISVEAATKLAERALKEFLAATAITLDDDQLNVIARLSRSAYEITRNQTTIHDKDQHLSDYR